MKTIFNIGRICEKVMLVIAVILLSIIPLAIGMQVMFRSLGFSLNWSEEISRFTYVCVTFLGSVLAVKHGRHITITFLSDKMPRLVQRVLGVIVHLFMAFFMVLCVYGTSLIMASSRNIRSNSMQWFHLNYMHGFVFVCCILMIIVCVIRAFEYALDKVELVENVTGGAI